MRQCTQAPVNVIALIILLTMTWVLFPATLLCQSGVNRGQQLTGCREVGRGPWTERGAKPASGVLGLLALLRPLFLTYVPLHPTGVTCLVTHGHSACEVGAAPPAAALPGSLSFMLLPGAPCSNHRSISRSPLGTWSSAV